MKKIYSGFLMLILFFVTLNGYSQISQGGSPLSFQDPQGIMNNLSVETMPGIDLARLMAEDSINDINKDIPWRFGENIPVNYDLDNSGSWNNFSSGDRIWRLGIKCPGAYTINLTFDNYHLPPGARLFIYNVDHTQIIGAFTEFNNREDRVFATTLLKGEEIVIEYFEPAKPSFRGELHLNRVTHGYRDVLNFVKSFGSSGSCNNNVHCPEADAWQNQVRSACMLVSGGNGFCSGALVNNTNQDGIPYILTANHCYSNPASWVFWFNWESPTCTNPPSSPPYNSISGATLKAKNAASDFCLVQMSSTPPVNYNVYYAGWNKKDTAASSGGGIHHPSGDIKKISYSNSPYTSDTWSGTPANSHWKVNWSDGVTEPGSSGSPIFDQNHRIVGQLHGGPSACGASQLWDFYGKFAMSWEYGTTPATRLRDWLDPANLGPDTINGWDPNLVPVVQTIAATNIAVTSATLNGTVNPNGIATSYHFDWGTTLAFDSTTVSIPAGTGTTPVPVNAEIAGLTAETQYFFRIVGTTSAHTYIGDTLSFVTKPLPTLAVTPPNQIVGTAPGTTTFHVTSNIDWTVASDAAWCTPTPSGTGSDTIFATYTENTSVLPRVAQITVSGIGVVSQTVTVSQDGIPIILNVTPPNRDVTSSAGNTTFNVSSNTTWTVTADSAWVTVTPSGTGNDTLHVTFSENTSILPRVATITVSAGGISPVSVTVSQGATPLVLSVTPPNQNVSAQSGNTNFTVTSNAAWTVTSDVAWCTPTAGGSGNGTIVADFTENTARIQRTATISVTVPTLPVQTVFVTQAKSTIGIDEQNAKEVMIYPNPSNGLFKIVPSNGNHGKLDIQVIDLHGRVILDRQFNGKNEYQVDLSSAPAGSYEIKVTMEDAVVLKKLVILKK
jgi:hypothetical protein